MKDDLKATYNRIAEDWHRDHQKDDWWFEGLKAFTRLLSKGSSVLDIGCGGGTPAKYLAAEGLRVTGIDFSEKMIAIARRNVPQGKFLVMDAHELEKLKEEWDGIYMQAFLLHIPKNETEEIVKRALLYLRPNGLLLTAVKEQKEGQSEEEIKKENTYGYPYERFFSYYTVAELESLYKRLDLAVVYKTIRTVNKTRWLQIIGKKENR